MPFLNGSLPTTWIHHYEPQSKQATVKWRKKEEATSVNHLHGIHHYIPESKQKEIKGKLYTVKAKGRHSAGKVTSPFSEMLIKSGFSNTRHHCSANNVSSLNMKKIRGFIKDINETPSIQSGFIPM